MSHKFNPSSKTHRSSNAALHIKGSNRHNQPDRDELPEFEKFPKGSHAARRQSSEAWAERDE